MVPFPCPFPILSFWLHSPATSFVSDQALIWPSLNIFLTGQKTRPPRGKKKRKEWFKNFTFYRFQGFKLPSCSDFCMCWYLAWKWGRMEKGNRGKARQGKRQRKKKMKKWGERRRRHSMLSLKMNCYRNPCCQTVPDMCTKMLEVHEFQKGRQEV